MRRFSAISRAAYSLLFILAIASMNLLPFLLTQNVSAAGQLTNRSITLGSSKVSQTDVTYSVSVDVATGSVIQGIVIDFCDSASSPIIGNSCTGPTGLDTNEAGLAVANQEINSTPVSNAYTVNAATDTNTVVLTNATGNTPSANDTLTFDLGSSGGSDGITNPSSIGTFYARILTYSTVAGATGYVSTAPATGGAVLDQGAVALAIVNQLTISAKVIETLQFCVGSTTVDDYNTTIANDCSGGFAGSCGTAVDLGILDSGQVSISPVPVSTASLPGGGNACNGAAMVRTNASNGVAITYFAEQDTGSGKLKLVGATCSGSSNTDQCFNDNASQATFTAGTEAFGVTVAGTNCNGTSTTSYACDMTGGTNKLIASSGYIGDTATAYGTTNGFAWDDTGTTEELASSTGPVDDETLVLKFAATPTITTPTGSYTVTSTYVATATF